MRSMVVAAESRSATKAVQDASADYQLARYDLAHSADGGRHWAAPNPKTFRICSLQKRKQKNTTRFRSKFGP